MIPTQKGEVCFKQRDSRYKDQNATNYVKGAKRVLHHTGRTGGGVNLAVCREALINTNVAEQQVSNTEVRGMRLPPRRSQETGFGEMKKLLENKSVKTALLICKYHGLTHEI